MLNFELPGGHPSRKISNSYLNMYMKFNNIFSRCVDSDYSLMNKINCCVLNFLGWIVIEIPVWLIEGIV